MTSTEPSTIGVVIGFGISDLSYHHRHVFGNARMASKHHSWAANQTNKQPAPAVTANQSGNWGLLDEMKKMQKEVNRDIQTIGKASS
ncbi:MAG TPA: hypothetical protein VEI58_05985 [Chthoniobacterales bacterium]|nr:hypothetical protein [Chthoniobacterales bacterium]